MDKTVLAGEFTGFSSCFGRGSSRLLTLLCGFDHF